MKSPSTVRPRSGTLGRLLDNSGYRMHRFESGLEVLAILVATLVSSAGHAATLIALGTAGAGPGETAMVPVRLQSDSAQVALQFDIRFDPAQLRPGTALTLSGATTTVALSSSPQAGLQRIVVYTRDGSALGTGDIANLTWYVPPNAGPSQATLSVTNAIVSDRSATAAPVVSTSNGVITIRSDTAPVLQDATVVAGQFVVRLLGQSGKPYRLQSSSDLIQWNEVGQGSPVDGVMTFRDPILPNRNQRFYRAQSLP
ncbi:MAG: hypothetical protein JNK85_14075 [Verrucomicrobiales bacterium]|nr:hypothetical protein [Verrucomicrobiales bacterium]